MSDSYWIFGVGGGPYTTHSRFPNRYSTLPMYLHPLGKKIELYPSSITLFSWAGQALSNLDRIIICNILILPLPLSSFFLFFYSFVLFYKGVHSLDWTGSLQNRNRNNSSGFTNLGTEIDPLAFMERTLRFSFFYEITMKTLILRRAKNKWPKN